MQISRPQDHSEFNLEQIINDLDKGALYDARNHLHSLYPAEIALMLKSLPVDYRYQLWRIMAPEAMGATLAALQGEVRIGLIERTSASDLVAAVSKLGSREMADLVADFSAETRDKVLKKQGNSRLEAALSYDGHTAAGLMSLDAMPIRLDITVEAALAHFRAQQKMPANMVSLSVVDQDNRYQGMVSVASILTSDSKVMIKTLITPVAGIPLNMPIAEVAALFEHKDILSVAVVDDKEEVVGRITLEEVFEVIREEADRTVLSAAGLDEEHDLFAPVFVSAKRRAVWLGVNLFTAFLASWVIGLFEATIDQIVALAVLMPVVASMGGIAGSQTLTLVIRGLALHQISSSNAMSFLFKELAIGAVNGIVWSVVVAMIAGAWFSNMPLGIMLGGAMVINLSCASLAGVLIPLFLQKRGIDPALAGGVLLTTVTDVIGFMSFLGLATIFLLA